MTHEAQRIAIAEACGWKPGGSGKTWGDGQTFGVPPNGEDWHWQEMPDYFNDLNAMHEAEKVLDYNQLCDMENSISFQFGAMPFHSTAGHRAEAFLRTLNLYTPTP